MRTIDRILKIIETHPNGLTNLQILNIMDISKNDCQEVRAQKLTQVSIRCHQLERQGFVRCEKRGRSPIWFPVEE